MNTMQERKILIEALLSRGFKAGPFQDFGWTYKHYDDGFTLSFHPNGRYALDTPSGKAYRASMADDASDVLKIIDEEAKAL